MSDKPALRFPEAIPAALRETLAANGIRKVIGDGEILVRAGTECVYLPLVLRGTLRIFKNSETGRELTLYRIEEGESCVLTATCILNGGSFPAIAVAEGETEVLLVPSRLLTRLVEQSPQWRAFVFGLYARRLEGVLALVEEVAFQHMDARLASLLLRRAEERDGTVSMTHARIASELGTSREVVTRILKDFEAGGLIVTRRGGIGILKPEDLRARTGVLRDV